LFLNDYEYGDYLSDSELKVKWLKLILRRNNMANDKQLKYQKALYYEIFNKEEY
jgi:hypothetical protein